MKVFVCGSYTPSLVNFRGLFLRELLSHGHEVVVSAPERHAASLEWFRANGIRFVPSKMSRTGLNPISDLRYVASLVRTLQKEKPDVFVAYTIKPIVFGIQAAFLAGVPRRFALITGLGFSFMGHTLKQKITNVISRSLYWAALKKCASVCFQNEEDELYFRKLGLLSKHTASRVVNGSGVDLAYFAEAPLPDTESEIRALLIARLIGEKGLHEYVAAARALKKKFPQVRFQLLGGFEDRPGAISAATVAEWEREGAVEYLGEQSDVRPYLEACHLYVLPSYREGMPRTILEAMAVGRPILTTDVTGCRATVSRGENGWLVAAKNAAALTSGFEEALAQRDRWAEMGKKSRRKAEGLFDVHKVNEQMMDWVGLA